MMKGRKPRIIKDKKERGEWAESVFIARAKEYGLPVSKPQGDSTSFDCVVGRPGKFVAVQVKSTIATLEKGTGYNCSTCSSHKAYRAGAFDFLAAYVIPEDLWYIIPAKEIRGLKSISLCTTEGEAKYEKYREAWHLLREAAAMDEDAVAVGQKHEAERVAEKKEVSADATPATRFPRNGLERLEASLNFFRRQLERGRVIRPKENEDG